MRKLLSAGVLFGLMVCVTNYTYAQRPFQGFTASGPIMLTNKSVQEELKITDDQKEKLGEKMRSMIGKYTEVFAKAKGEPGEMEKLMKVVQDAATKELAEILKPEQMQRLKQIERQQSITRTLTDDNDAIKDLGITDEQKDRIKQIGDESVKEVADLLKQFGKDNARETNEKVLAARKEANERATKLLTETQQAKWKEMIGEPFELKQEAMGLPGFLKKGKGK